MRKKNNRKNYNEHKIYISAERDVDGKKDHLPNIYSEMKAMTQYKEKQQ